MATSGAFTTSNKYINYRIEVTQNWQDTANNYSNVTVKVFVYRTNTGYTTYGKGTLYCGIDGTSYSQGITSSQKITNSGIYLFERTVNIYHNGDGAKSIWVSAYISHERVTSNDQGFTVYLDTIPRRSTITGISGDWFGDPMTVTIDRKSSSFNTDVYVKANGDWRNVVWHSSDTSIGFTLPADLANNVTTSTECTGQVKIVTNNGDTYIGEDVWDKWMGVPSWMSPSISNVALDTDTCVNELWCWVQNKSKLRVRTTCSGSYGSWITTIRVEYDGTFYWGNDIWTNITAIDGDRPVHVSVWDSRGRQANWSGHISVHWYQNPWGTLEAYRCTADGTRDDVNGTYVRVIYSGDKASISGHNTFSLTIDSRETNYEWSSARVYTTTPTSWASAIIGDGHFDLDKTYQIRLRVADWYTTTTKIVPISTSKVLLDFKAGGTGLGVGRVATLDNVTQFATGVEIYSGRDNRPDLGADLVFKNCGNKAQDIGVCGAVPNSNELLNIYRFTDSEEGSAGTIWKIDKWNCIYNRASQTFIQRNIRFYDGESSVRYDGAPSYQFFNNSWLGYYDDSAGMIWGFDYSTKVLTLKAGYTTSDERKKYDIDKFSNWDDFYNFYMSLNPITYKYNEDMIEDTHIGFIAQEVAESIVDNNLANEKLAVVKCLPNDDYDDGREYQVCYQEMIALNTKMIQKHEKEIQELKNIIAQQQELINQLLAKTEPINNNEEVIVPEEETNKEGDVTNE